MTHVRLGAVQQSLELQSIGVPVGDHISHLPDYCGEDEYANQVADDRENVSAKADGAAEHRVRLQCVCVCVCASYAGDAGRMHDRPTDEIPT